MDKKNALFVFAGIIVFSLFGLLGIYAIQFYKNVDYIDLEKTIVAEMKSLEGYKEGMGTIDTVIIPTSEIDRLAIEGAENCVAYGVIKKYLFIYNYKSYIKCDDYTTNGFDLKSASVE